MTEPVIQMVGLANDDKPNKIADIFADEMQDRIGDHVQAAKDVISNNLFGTELPDEQDAELEDIDNEVELEPEAEEMPDHDEVEYEDAEEVEGEEPVDYEADQEVIEEPADDSEPSEEEEEN